ATAEAGLRSEDRVETQVNVDAIQLSMQAPEALIVAEPVIYNIAIRNTGDRPLVGLRLEDVFDNGLSHPLGADGRIVNDQLGSLAIGEEKTLQLELQTKVPGRFHHTLTVAADGVAGKSKTAWVTVNPPPPEP